METVKLVFQALLIYVAIDVGYQATIGFQLMTHFVASAGINDIYTEPSRVGLALMAVFFFWIAFVNVKLCIQPGLRDRKVTVALVNGGLLGSAAYATLGLTNAWGLEGFPLAFALTITLEGLALSALTSGGVVWWNLRGDRA